MAVLMRRLSGRRHTSPSVLVPALRTVGNIVTGDDLQTQMIINSGALGCLLHLLTSTQKKSIKKVIPWPILSCPASPTIASLSSLFSLSIIFRSFLSNTECVSLHSAYPSGSVQPTNASDVPCQETSWVLPLLSLGNASASRLSS